MSSGTGHMAVQKQSCFSKNCVCIKLRTTNESGSIKIKIRSHFIWFVLFTLSYENRSDSLRGEIGFGPLVPEVEHKEKDRQEKAIAIERKNLSRWTVSQLLRHWPGMSDQQR